MVKQPRTKATELPLGTGMPSGNIERYFKIPDWMFMDDTVGWGAKLMYAVVEKFTGTHNFPDGGLEFAQDILKISRGELFKRLRELESAGFISRSLAKFDEDSANALGPDARRRIKITPIHNPKARDFYKQYKGALEVWQDRHRGEMKCRQTETLRNNKENLEAPLGDITNVVEAPLGDNTNIVECSPEDITVGSTLLYREPFKREPFKREPGFSENLPSNSQDQKQPLSFPSGLETLEPKPTPPQNPSPGLLPEDSKIKNFTSYDLQLDEMALVFVRNAYRSSGLKLNVTEAKKVEHRLIEGEQSYSREEFRTAVWIYLNTESDWLHENKWPINAFLKNPRPYLPDYSSLPSRSTTVKPNITQTYQSGTTAPGIAHSAFGEHFVKSENSPQPAKENLPAYLQYVNKWNTIVPSKTCGDLKSWEVRAVNAALKDPEFVECWEELVELCGKIVRNKPDSFMAFPWLFTVSAGMPQWQQLLSGKMTWAVTAKSASGSAADQAMEEALRQEREKGNL